MYTPNLYAKKSTLELRQLRSKKHARLAVIGATGSWFTTRERDMLERTIKQIDVELAAREAQLTLL